MRSRTRIPPAYRRPAPPSVPLLARPRPRPPPPPRCAAAAAAALPPPPSPRSSSRPATPPASSCAPATRSLPARRARLVRPCPCWHHRISIVSTVSAHQHRQHSIVSTASSAQHRQPSIISPSPCPLPCFSILPFVPSKGAQNSSQSQLIQLTVRFITARTRRGLAAHWRGRRLRPSPTAPSLWPEPCLACGPGARSCSASAQGRGGGFSLRLKVFTSEGLR